MQNAYEVLSDKHERAWCALWHGMCSEPCCRLSALTKLPRRYDSHRDAILHPDAGTHQAGDTGVAPTQARDSVNLYPYFSPSCFKGYGDGPKARTVPGHKAGCM